MKKVGVLRPLKTGGYSLCYAAEENVGKRKCNHIADTEQEIQVQKEFRGPTVVNIEEAKGKISLDEASKKVESFVTGLRKDLTSSERKKVLRFLRG